ncbi:H-NS family nucleoid-associated regulatory protein (plasmid) [Pseudoduganella sp. UC29_106]|uniref:H-NS histone family protein n=1 Tax=Pseudoduganella sp. UC29_106 TaxID=3374553 RepID=UPI003756348A
MTDLSKMSLKELRELKSNTENEIAARMKSEVENARSQIHQIAANLGVSVQDLIGGSLKVKPAGKSVPAKYRNPSNSTQVWTGRGRQPQWVKDALESGKALQDLEIKS